jgi:hypothetical protein
MKAWKDWFAKLANEHPFAVAWAVILVVLAFVSRLNDVASFKEKFDWILQHGTYDDKEHHLILSSPWFFLLFFALATTWIIWPFLYAVATFRLRKAQRTKNERQTTAYETLQGMMTAASRIRDRLNPAHAMPQKALKSVRMIYLISKDFSTEVTREYEVLALNDILHYWNLGNRPTEYADPVDYLDDIDFKVSEMNGIGEVAYLPTKNEPRDKRITFYFLPRLEPGNPARRIQMSFKWPGFNKKLDVTGEEDISFTLSSVLPIESVRVEVYLERDTGRNLEGLISGPNYAGSQLYKQNHPNTGWGGFVYLIENAPSGVNRYAVTAKLEKP